MNNRNKAFTLIELLVVIAIIGVLAAGVLISLTSARKKARDTKRVSDIKQIQLALEMYFGASNSYPTDLSSLVTGNLIASVPFDPLGFTAYSYATSGDAGAACATAAKNCTYYHLGASLEEQSNLALTTDKDCSSVGITCPTAAAYPNTPFDGGGGTPEAVQKCNAADNGSYCYDVAP